MSSDELVTPQEQMITVDKDPEVQEQEIDKITTETTNTTTDDNNNTQKTNTTEEKSQHPPKPSRMDSWKSRLSQSTDYLSKTTGHIAKSLKDNVTKLTSNIYVAQKSHENGRAPLDTKQEFFELRDRIKQDNVAMKRAVIEKCYQDFYRKLYIPFVTDKFDLNENKQEEEVDIAEMDVQELSIPGHTDVAAEFDSIYIGIYNTALDMWAEVVSSKNDYIAKEVLFQTIMNCYYRMVCQKKNILKTYHRVDHDREKFLTFAAFEKNYSKGAQANNEASSLCQQIVNEIFEEIVSLYLEDTAVKQFNELESVTKAFIAKCCEVIWCFLCSETREKSTILYPLYFHMQNQPYTVEWFEYETGSTKSNQETYVSFPAVVQINKKSATHQTLLCKAKVFHK